MQRYRTAIKASRRVATSLRQKGKQFWQETAYTPKLKGGSAARAAGTAYEFEKKEIEIGPGTQVGHKAQSRPMLLGPTVVLGITSIFSKGLVLPTILLNYYYLFHPRLVGS